MLFQGFERKKVDVDGIAISCATGGGGPPVLLLHGFPQCLAMWARTAPLLAEKFTVVAADLRGYGDSAKPKAVPDGSTYSFRSMAGDQLGLMRALGHERFHVVGHDRGGRTGHRMALDHPEAVASLAVLDIVPTHAMFMETNRHVAGVYWHWYFLSQPEPFPERLIGADPDYFYETCLLGWGAARARDFDPAMLAEYRRCWRDPAMIHGSCSDYRSAATVDLEHDSADFTTKLGCPTLAFWGTEGAMHGNFDIGAAWQKRAAELRTASLPAGHFFIDKFPEDTARILTEFLSSVRI